MATCRKCDIELTNDNWYECFSTRGIRVCKSCDIAYAADQYGKNRLIVLEKLGNKCVCCGENNVANLSIDHINGGGNQEKKKLRGKSYLMALKKMDNIQKKYRCLCYNCNYCIGFWGKCQHDI